MTGSHSESSWIACYAQRRSPRVRLVCFPHGGGGPSAYRAWEAHLPDWIEVLCVNPPGRGQRMRDAAVDDMDTAVTAVATDLAPYCDAPLVLFGHSVGGLVAFEVARRLERDQSATVLRAIISGLPAPEVLEVAPALSDDADDVLLAALDAFGLVPRAVLDVPELRQMMLSAVRTDFRLCEAHRVPDNAMLEAPLTVLGGRSDDQATEPALQGWRNRTRAAFTFDMFDGDHFFVETAREPLLTFIAETIEHDLESRPGSLLIGATEDYPVGETLHDLFRRAAAATPNALALHGIDRKLTFGGLDRESDLLARRLRALGLGVDRIAVLLLDTSVDFVVAYLAALKAGGAYLPLPLATPPHAIADILTDVKPAAVVTRSAFANRLPETWRDETRTVVLDAGWQDHLAALPLPDLDDAFELPGPDSLAYCVTSSGTTGAPKAILCPHRGAVNSYWWRYVHLPYGTEEREACNVFLVWEVLRPLLQGRPAYIIPDDVVFDPRRLIAFLKQHHITRVLFTPSLFEQLLVTIEASQRSALSSLRMVILNGEVVSRALRNRAKACLPHVTLINDYSISECHDVTTSNLAEAECGASGRFLPVGRVMANVRVYLLDDNKAPVPWGLPGEVYVAGPTLARGYLNLPDETAARFVPDPFQAPPARMFRTGDIGRALPDGQLEITGRAKFMVKLRGYTIVPSAVEAAITSNHEIAAAAVVAIDDPHTGQPERLVAYIAGQSGQPGSSVLRDLRAHLQSRLPAYAIPSEFIPLAELPIAGTTGKVDRKQLPPPTAGTQLREAHSAPPTTDRRRTEVTAKLRGIWTGVLGRTPAGDDDNFFDLGGHSLLAIDVVRRTEAAFAVTLNVIDVFNYPTLDSFSRHVASRMAPVSTAHGRRHSGRLRPDASASADIAVVGMACRFPGANTPDALWANLQAGTESIRQFTDDELRAFGVPGELIDDPNYVKAGALLDDVASFDPAFFSLSMREAILMDPQHRLFIECCWEAMERSGHAPGRADGRVGVFAGCYLPGYLVHHLGAAQHLDPADPTRFHLSETGNDKDYLASRVAHLLDLNGPAIAVQTSCSTGLVAITQAVQAIRAGQCEMALAGASSLMFPRGGYMHVAGHVNSASGHCRTFDAAADGTILGDGVGAVLLRPLHEALASGDRVLAVIKGFAVNNDGALRAGYSAPGVRGQVEVIGDAIAHADVDPETIGYVEAHGTATTVGDPIEVRALSEAWQQHTDASQVAVIGSIKPNIGHANIAAGVAGFMKVVLMLQHRQITPQINFRAENPDLRLAESPFRIATEAEDWPPPQTGPRMGAVSSFGIGGTNAHMILAEAPQRPDSPPQPPMTDVIPLSARSPGALAHLRESVSDHVQATHEPFTNVAATCQLGRRQMPYRAAVVATDNTSAAAALTAWRPEPDRHSNTTGVVFLFPGQGAQHAEMGVSLLRDSPPFAAEFHRVASVFAPHIKYDLSDLANRAKASRLLAAADGLQPALFAVEYALARSLTQWGIQPIAMVGHSLGAYVAATLAGLLSLEDAVRLVAERSKAMEAAPEGAMVVVEADCDTAASLIRDFANVSIAAINSRDDVVVSGPPQAVSEIRKRAAVRNIAAHDLTVARAFHSPMMQGAANTIAGVSLTNALEPHDHGIRVACNVTGDWMTATQAQNPAYWAEHALAPVRFDENLMAALALQPAVVMEVGPGQSLRRLVRKASETRTDTPAYTSTMRHPRDEGKTDWDALCHALAQTWQCGIDLDWAAFRNDRPPVQRVQLPTYPFERKRYWPDHDASTTHNHKRRLSGDDERRALPWTDRFYTPSLQRVTAALPHRQSTSLGAQRWLVLADRAQQGDVESAVIASLEAQCDTTILDVGGLSDVAPRRLTDALTGFAQCDGDRRILLTSTLTLKDDDLSPNSGSALAAPMGVIRALAHVQSNHPIQVWPLTRGGMAVSGEAMCPTASMIGGPLTVLSQENPIIETRQIDLPFRSPADDQADFVSAVVDECTAHTPRREVAVAIRAHGRWAVRYDQLKLSDDQRVIGRGRLEAGPHIVTGGSGRIGLALARYLIGLGADVCLVSRSAMPPRKDWPSIVADPDVAPEIRQRLESLVAIDAGPGHLTLVQGDVSEPGHMTNLLCNIADRHGQLGGIFHAAGIADLQDLDAVTPETLAAELSPKVAGTIALNDAVRTCQKDLNVSPAFVMLFSSLAGVLGGFGLGAYAAANRFQDSFVDANPVRDGVPWISIAWDDWRFDYGSQQQAAYAHTRAELSIPPNEGIAAIEAVLGEPALSNVLVSATPLVPRMERWVLRRVAEPSVAGNEQDDLVATPKRDIDLPCSNGRTQFEQIVFAAYAKALGDPQIDIDDDFFALGGDSLLATEIVLDIGTRMSTERRIRITDVFDHPTVRKLAKHIKNLGDAR